ncbi:hypothetical protein BCR37DRAFT_392252 [Protomyces lactucae-debilis]|uniref:Uncharacterized protein n=1 Tax=Protomyces lactucae-debilis TaxID=2754530 RepID=A0A1Y2FIP1_PROLT|nr:uncharacterized protein BCR37DRAFT_392252 [Protomyces lactucae-debilis]ORY83803.1 hypothetical protein BCR37DRAFT_392252 [Protomyces lactucae-debilis]
MSLFKDVGSRSIFNKLTNLGTDKVWVALSQNEHNFTQANSAPATIKIYNYFSELYSTFSTQKLGQSDQPPTAPSLVLFLEHFLTIVMQSTGPPNRQLLLRGLRCILQAATQRFTAEQFTLEPHDFSMLKSSVDTAVHEKRMRIGQSRKLTRVSLSHSTA